MPNRIYRAVKNVNIVYPNCKIYTKLSVLAYQKNDVNNIK